MFKSIVRKLFLSTLISGLVLPAYAQNSIPLGETVISSPVLSEQEKQAKFVSKFEVDLNEDKKSILDIASGSLKISVPPAQKYNLSVNGKEIDSKLLGKVQINNDNNHTIYTYYGVTLLEGKNEVLVNFFDLTGKYINSFERNVFVKGKPNKFVFPEFKVPADGKTIQTLEIKVLDEWNNPVPDDIFITVETDNGAIKSLDQDPNMNGVQLKTKLGSIKVDILPPNAVGTGNIKASVNTISEISTIEYIIPLRKPIMVGLASSKSGYSLVNGETFEGDRKGTPGLNFDIGASLFTQGTIWDEYLLTLAFDSRRKLNALNDDQNIMFRDRAEDRLYPIYGDSSQLNQIALSNSNVYFKLEKDKSRLLWGDFNTGFANVEVTTPRMSNYNRVLTGANLKLDLPGITNLEIFGAMSNQVFNRDEIRGAGVSGPYFTSQYPLVNGSERVIIETRDRTFVNKILKTTTLTRLSDYNIDYSTGAIIFSQPVPSFDENLNPNYIILTYEYYPKDISNSIAGVKLTQPLPLGATLGATYVREFSAEKPYQLTGISLGEKIGDKFEIVGEYANSFFENKYGSSYRAGLLSRPIDNLFLKGEYLFVDNDFSNKTGNSFAPGTERYFVRGEYKPFDITSLFVEFNRDRNYNTGNVLQALNGGLQQNIFSHQLVAGMEARQFSDPNDLSKVQNAALASLNYRSPMFYNFSLNASREQNLLATQDFTKPTLTSFGLDYALTDNLKLYAKQNFFERDKLTTATVFGADTIFNTGNDIFSSVNMGAKYQIDSAIDGKSAQTRIGFNNRINVLPELALGFNFERVNGNNPNLNISFDDAYNAYSISTDYAPSYLGVRASAKYDVRDGSRASSLFNFNVAGALGDDFGVFGKFLLSNSSEVARQGVLDTLFGLAYRPLSSDFFNGLLKYQVRRSRDGVEFSSEVLNNIFSFEGFFQPAYAWEIYTKLALKNSNDFTDTMKPINSNISLALTRLTYKVSYNFDIVGEYRNLAQFETATSFNDFTAEIGYFPIKDLRVSAGYNFFGYNDVDLITSNYSAQGPYVGLTFKMGNFGDIWGQNNVFTKRDLIEANK